MNATRRKPDHGAAAGELTTRGLRLRAETIDLAQRSVEAVLSTETPATVFDFRRFEVIDEILISGGLRSVDQVPLLESHIRSNLDSVFGSVRAIAAEKDKVVGRLFFAEGDERIDVAFGKVRQGHLTDVSVGYRAVHFVDIPAGQTQRVGGRSYTADARTLRVTTEWKLREVSLVPIGADEFAKIRDDAGLARGATPAAEAGTQENDEMNKPLRMYLEGLGLRESATDTEAWAMMGQLHGTQRAEADRLREDTAQAPDPARAEPPQPAATATTPPDPIATLVAAGTRSGGAMGRTPTPGDEPDLERTGREAMIAERQRIAAINHLAGDDVDSGVVQRAIDEGMTVDQASRAFLENVRTTRTAAAAPAIHTHNHEHDCTERALMTGMQLRAGLDVIDPDAPEITQREQAVMAEQGRRYADMAMVDVCREALRLAHLTVPHGRNEMIRAAVSTGSLVNIFSGVVNKALLTSYTEAPDTTAPFVRHVDLADFKTNERTQLGKTGSLEKLPRGGTATDATISDRMEQYKLARYAKKFTIDDQDIIDDDMNALLNMPQEMGAAAARLLGDLVYSILMGNPTMGDGAALFHATHNNTAATAAFARATLKTALTTLRTQQYDGVNLGLFGKAVIVPHALRFDAKELIRSQEIRPAGSTDREVGNFNVLADEGLGLISDSRLDNGITDPATGVLNAGSATTWYVAASGGRHTIEVGHLRGTGRRPTIRSYVLDQGQYGIGWDIKSDIAAKALDWRGLYRATA